MPYSDERVDNSRCSGSWCHSSSAFRPERLLPRVPTGSAPDLAYKAALELVTSFICVQKQGSDGFLGAPIKVFTTMFG
jgi:hypothetical protein